MSKEEQLTDNQLDTVLEFVNGLASTIGGLYSPFSANNNLLKINNNPLKPTREKLEKALSSVPYDANLVSRYSEFMQVWDNIYNRTLDYYKGLLAYDLSWVCTNAKSSDYNTQEYKDDLKRLYKFFDKFNYKNEFDKITSEVLKKGVSYVWFRDSQPIDQIIDITDKRAEAFGLQIMPDAFCKITGYTSSGLPLYDFDVNYFLQTDVDINLFAPSLIRKFRKAYSDDNGKYTPSSEIGKRNGIYGSQWVQTDYRDGAFCIKWDISNYRILPPFASLMKSCLTTDEVEALKRDRDILGSYYLLSGSIQLLKDTKTVKSNQFAISPQVLGSLMQLVTSGLNNCVKSIAMPLEDTKGWQYQNSEPNLLSNHLKTISGEGASASELIYHTENLSQFAMQSAQENDFGTISPLYEQYANLLNIFVNRKTKKFKFKFALSNMNRTWARKEKVETLMKYADKGIILGSSQWASALGMNPCDFDRSMDEGFNSDFTNKLKLMMNANTMNSGNTTSSSSTSTEGGRPKADTLEKSDSTEQNQDYMN